MREHLDINLKLLEDKYSDLRNLLSHCRNTLASLEHTVLKVLTAPSHLHHNYGILSVRGGTTADRDKEIDQFLQLSEKELDGLSLGGSATTTAISHAGCQDCSCVYMMANECLMNLATAQHVAEESTKRLEKIKEAEEVNKSLLTKGIGIL